MQLRKWDFFLCNEMHQNTYLRSTMLQEWLNAVMLLDVHKDLTDGLDLKSINNEFVCKSDHHKSKFPVH